MNNNFHYNKNYKYKNLIKKKHLNKPKKKQKKMNFQVFQKLNILTMNVSYLNRLDAF